MKRVVVYRFEDTDMISPGLIESSFNLLYEFAARFRDKQSAASRAFHRVTDNREFTDEDLVILSNYAESICHYAEQKYNQTLWVSAPWRDSILQNICRLRGAMAQLRAEVKCSNE